jgi:hypothetical protein
MALTIATSSKAILKFLHNMSVENFVGSYNGNIFQDYVEICAALNELVFDLL